jgi:hypothetical protein
MYVIMRCGGWNYFRHPSECKLLDTRLQFSLIGIPKGIINSHNNTKIIVFISRRFGAFRTNVAVPLKCWSCHSTRHHIPDAHKLEQQ